ncbi:MAG: glycerol kinase, partial [Firmicutes bacterium]|nr:glycerol kinase [Bacillota bacterium]
NDFLMSFQADILNKRIIRAGELESTAKGAAYLAGLGVGFWKDIEELKKLVGKSGEFSPKMSSEEREKRLLGWKKAIAKCRLDIGKKGEKI